MQRRCVGSLLNLSSRVLITLQKRLEVCTSELELMNEQQSRVSFMQTNSLSRRLFLSLEHGGINGVEVSERSAVCFSHIFRSC